MMDAASDRRASSAPSPSGFRCARRRRLRLKFLPTLLGRIELSKARDTSAALEAIRDAYPQVEDFERDFPRSASLWRPASARRGLWARSLSYLYLTGKSRHFFVLAPNKTIYEKLISDFSPESPKYVFKGIAEFAAQPAADHHRR